MKTRNIFAIFIALPLLAGLVGCKSEDELTAKPAKEILRVEGGGIELRAGDKTKDVLVYADCAWQVLDTDGGDFGNKLSVSPKAGNGNGTLVITVDENTGVVERKDTIVLRSAGGLMQKIPIRQVSGDPAMNLSTGNFNFNADGTSKADNSTTLVPLTITSNQSWTLQTVPGAWYRVVDAAGNAVTSGTAGATQVFVSVGVSTTDAERTSSFTLTYSGKTAQVDIVQDGMTNIFLNAQEQMEPFSAQGGEGMVAIESNAEWRAYIPSSVSWLHVEGSYDEQYWREHEQQHGFDNYAAIGVGNGELRVYCDPNTTGRDRLTAIVIVAGTRNPQQAVVLVEQYAGEEVPEYSLSVGDLTSMYVANTSAEFRFSFVSTDEVSDYGLVYSTSEQMPTVENSQSVVIGRGGKSGSILAPLDNLQETTTYYVRGFVYGQQGIVYTTNVVTITTSSSQREPGESDNPDPTLAPRK